MKYCPSSRWTGPGRGKQAAVPGPGGGRVARHHVQRAALAGGGVHEGDGGEGPVNREATGQTSHPLVSSGPAGGPEVTNDHTRPCRFLAFRTVYFADPPCATALLSSVQ